MSATASFVYLDELPIFASLSEDEISELSRRAVRRRFRGGSILQMEGQNGGFFAIVVSGSVQAVLFRPDGGTVHLEFHNARDCVGEFNIIEDSVPPHSLVVLDDSELLMFPAADIAAQMQSNGRFATELFTRQSRQLGILQQRLRDVVYERGDARILRYFEALALQIGVESPEGVFIDSRVTHQTIADTCGLARETVSRLLTNLKQRGQLFRTADGWVLNVKGSVRAEQC